MNVIKQNINHFTITKNLSQKHSVEPNFINHNTNHNISTNTLIGGDFDQGRLIESVCFAT